MRYALSTLKAREQEIIKLKYEDDKTYQEIGEIFSLSRARVGQINAKALRKLRHPSRLERIKYGFVGQQQRKQQLIDDCRNAKTREEQIEILKNVSFAQCGLSLRVHIRTGHHNISSLGGIMEIMDKDPSELAEILQNDEECLAEAFRKLGEYHVDCSKAKEVIGFNNRKRKENISELVLSHRTYTSLMRSGLDSIAKLETLIRDDPERLLRIRGLNDRSIEELLSKLENEGIDVTSVRKLSK